MKKKSSELDIPTLKDVIVPGKEVTETEELPPVLNELLLQGLSKQIEKIVQTQLQATMQKASQMVLKELQAYLDKRLPELLQAAINLKKREEE
jgi:hypothetical protein